MVDSPSHTKADGVTRNQRTFLSISPWEHQRYVQHAMINPMELSHNIFPRVVPHIYSWIKLYGMNFLNWIGPQAELVVTDFELIKVIMNNKDGAYPKSDLLGHTRKLFGDGLVTTQGEKWRKQRKLANHAFGAECLKGMAPAMISSVEMMLKRWRNHEGKEIEVTKEFQLLTSEVISRTAFGSSYLEGENIFNMLRKMVLILSRTTFRIRNPGIGKLVKTRDDVEANRLEQGIRDSIIKMVRKREEKVMSGEADCFGNDFLGSLLNAYHSDDDSKKLSLDDTIDECKTILCCWTRNNRNLAQLDCFSSGHSHRLARESKGRSSRVVWPRKSESSWHCKINNCEQHMTSLMNVYLFKPERFAEEWLKQLTTTQLHFFHLVWGLGLVLV